MDQKIVLIADDSPELGENLVEALKDDIEPEIIWAKNHKDAATTLRKSKLRISAAVINYDLSGAASGETLHVALTQKVPTLAVTATMNSQVRDRVWAMHVADYVLKDSPACLDYVTFMVKRIINNRNIKTLIVDDSATIRDTIRHLLQIHCYQVLAAGSGEEALEILAKNRDLRLVIADYRMPGMNGIDLVRKIREQYSRNEVGVIGISAAGDALMAAQFIKNGANDFIIKQNFLTEEFYCRVSQCMSQIEHVQAIHMAAIKDPLTDLYNRRYFFELGNKMIATAEREKAPVVVAMMDIDFFKKINDEHGHQVGDQVLKQLAALFNKRSRKNDLVARFGGEEFCFLGYNMNLRQAVMFFDMICSGVATHSFETDRGETIPVTISIGVCLEQIGNLEEMLEHADVNLYKAKEGGRNRVVASKLDGRNLSLSLVKG